MLRVGSNGQEFSAKDYGRKAVLREVYRLTQLAGLTEKQLSEMLMEGFGLPTVEELLPAEIPYVLKDLRRMIEERNSLPQPTLTQPSMAMGN